MNLITWIGANTFAILGIIFYAGQLVNTVKDLKDRLIDAERHIENSTSQAIIIATLATKVELLKETIEGLRKNIYDLKSELRER